MAISPIRTDHDEDRTYRTRRSIVASAVLFLLLIAGVIGYWLWQSHHFTMQRAREITQSFTLTYAAYTRQALDDVARVLQELGTLYRSTGRTMVPPDMGAFLRFERDQIALVREFMIADADGNPELWTGAWPPPEPLARDPAYRAHVASGSTDPWLGPTYRDTLADDRFTVVMAHTIRDETGTPTGSVIALIDQKAFSDAYQTILESEQASVALVHFDGTIMVRLPDPGEAVGQIIPAIANRVEPGPMIETFIQASPVDNVVRVISERRVGNYPLITGVTVARKAALAPWRQDVAWGLGVMLLAAMAVTALTHGLLRQVRLQAEAQQAVQRQNTVLTAQQETSTDGILVVDLNHTILTWNRRFAELWGLSDADLGRDDARALLALVLDRVRDPETFSARIQALYENLDTDELGGLEVEMRDGRILERYSRALRGADGNAWGRVWFYRDITQRRRDEQALRESEQRFRDVANAADEYIWEVDAQGCLTFITDRASDILGFEPEEMLGRSPFEFIAPDDMAWVRALFQDAVARRVKFEIPEYRAIRKDNTTVWQRTSAVPVLDENGDLRGYRGASMSINDIKARELEAQEANSRLEEQASALVGLAEQLDTSNREIRRVQERFDLAMRGTTDGIYDWDLLSNRIYLSPRWRDMLGLGDNEAEVSPHYWTRRIHPEDYLDSVRALSAHLAAESGQYRHVHRVRHQDGGYLWVLDRAQVVRDVEGQAARLVGTHADITEMRQFEEALRQAKIEAEAANAAKSRFLAVMSHEIRTPMTGVLGMTDLLLASNLSDRQRSFAATLKRSADTLLGLLDDILDFSKIEAGQLVLEHVDFALETVIDDVIQLFTVNASEKGLALETAHRVDPPPAVRGDPHRLRQILFNLVGNAIKFTEKGGVTVSLEDCASDPETPDGLSLTFAVADTGIGLSDDQCRRLFQPFIQADDTTTRRFGGTGLGLAICRRLVEAMGGSIGVDSTPGQGSVFRFTIRAVVGDPAAVAPMTTVATLPEALEEPAHGRPTPGTRLLLAEDTTANRLLIATILERMGYTVDEAADGAEALATVQRDPKAHALVIMDMQMPVMDGMAATRAIRALPGDPPPVIGLTADAVRENWTAYRSAGLAEILTKPVDWALLERVVATHARHGFEAGTPVDVAPGEGTGPAPGPVPLAAVEEADSAALPDDGPSPDPGLDSPPSPASPPVPTPEPEPNPAQEPKPESESESESEREPPPRPTHAGADADLAPGPVPGEVVAALHTITEIAESEGDLPPVFDPAALEALRTRIGTARLAPIVRSMLSNLDTQMETLAVAVEHGDEETFGRVGHSLKGLASQFGAGRLAREGHRLQHEVMSSLEARIATLAQLQSLAETTREAVDRWLRAHEGTAP